MTLNPKKRIAAFAGLVLLIIAAGYWFYPKETTDEYLAAPEYIFDKSHHITLDDVITSRKPIPRDARDAPGRDRAAAADGSGSETEPREEFDIRELFSEALINSHTTLRYFKHLETLFKDSANLGDHLERARQYLFSEFSASEARQLFEAYEKYIECEIALSNEFMDFGLVRTPQDAIAMLQRIQDVRREMLGEELADQLYGAEVKAREYAFRRAAIVGDDLYGTEKEALLNTLNTDMWGDEADAVASHPNEYTRYRETLQIYEKDLSEMPSEDARQEKIQEFRRQFFEPEAVERLEAVDRQIEREKQRETLYREKEARLRQDTALTEEEKQAQILDLQDDMFGQDAEAFRRSETMRIEREKMMEKYQGKGIQSR